MAQELNLKFIERLAIKHESMGFGVVGADGLTCHTFEPAGLERFVRDLLEAQGSNEKHRANILRRKVPVDTGGIVHKVVEERTDYFGKTQEQLKSSLMPIVVANFKVKNHHIGTITRTPSTFSGVFQFTAHATPTGLALSKNPFNRHITAETYQGAVTYFMQHHGNAINSHFNPEV